MGDDYVAKYEVPSTKYQEETGQEQEMTVPREVPEPLLSLGTCYLILSARRRKYFVRFAIGRQPRGRFP
jgi:hypothetical protein